jgi:hypothetical protein
LRSAWLDDDTLTEETVEAWKNLIDWKRLELARGPHGPPRFP